MVFDRIKACCRSLRDTVFTVLQFLLFKRVVRLGRRWDRTREDYQAVYWHAVGLFIWPFGAAVFIAPLIFLALIWSFDNGPCQWSRTRPWLGARCWSELDVPTLGWVRDRWDQQQARGDYLTLHPSLEAFLTAPMTIRDWQARLEHGGSKLARLRSDDPGVRGLLKDIESVTSDAANTADESSDYIYTFCSEKDNINMGLSSLMRTYADAAIVDHKDTWYWSFPFITVVQEWNRMVLVTWLPEPKTQTRRLEAQIQSKAKTFVDEAILSLESIISSSPTTDSQVQSLIRSLSKAQDTVRTVIKSLNENQAGWFPHYSTEPGVDRNLATAIQVAEGMYTDLVNFKETVKHQDSLCRDMLAYLKAHRKSIDMALRWGLTSPRVVAARDQLLKKPEIDREAWKSRFIADFPKHCESDKDQPSELNPFCLLHTVGCRSAEIDGDAFGDKPRSWIVERKAAETRQKARMNATIAQFILGNGGYL